MKNSKGSTRLDRRSFLAQSAIAAGIGMAAPFTSLLARGPNHPRNGRGPSPDYGPLQEAIAGQGQIFEYDPANERLRLLFESPSADVLNAPDNITVSPRGGLVLCEDGDGTEYVHGLTTDGVIFRFVQNTVDLRTTPNNGFNQDYRGSEFAGACYSPDGKWLFVNIQSPGISFAITGPWGSGGI